MCTKGCDVFHMFARKFQSKNAMAQSMMEKVIEKELEEFAEERGRNPDIRPGQSVSGAALEALFNEKLEAS